MLAPLKKDSEHFGYGAEVFVLSVTLLNRMKGLQLPHALTWLGSPSPDVEAALLMQLPDSLSLLTGLVAGACVARGRLSGLLQQKRSKICKALLYYSLLYYIILSADPCRGGAQKLRSCMLTAQHYAAVAVFADSYRPSVASPFLL